MLFQKDTWRILIFSILFIQNSKLTTQNLLYPLKIEPTLAGNYAELRRNHFHMGLDFKTDNKENLPIIAIESGYISRVLISPNGYGKAIYINHPHLNLTSVYAHLNEFEPQLQAWVDKMQYSLEKNTLDTTISPHLFPINKGQQIALSGNTGSSDGPHLHFEIRNMSTEKTINPLLYYPKLEDTIRPIISNILFYSVGTNSEFIKAIEPKNTRGKTIEINSGFVGIAVSALDKMNNSENNLGLYALRIYADNELIYQFKLDSLDFNWGSYIKTVSDYELPYSDIYKGFYEKCSFNITDKESPNGVINLNPNEPKKIRIEVYDATGNSSQEEFSLKNTSSLKFFSSYGKSMNCNSDEVITDSKNFSLYFQPKTFAEDYQGLYSMNTKLAQNELFQISFLTQNTAVLKPFEMIYYGKFDQKLKSKIYLESKVDNKHKAYIGNWSGSQIRFSKIKNMGEFIIKYDLKAPIIEPKPIISKTEVIFIAKDNESGIDTYKLTIDGQWCKLYNNQKINQFIYTIKNKAKAKKVKALIEVTDKVGNKNMKSMEIFF